MRFALNSLAVLAPEWLLAYSDDTWLDRYGHRFEEAHLPKGQVERQIITERIGQDGAHLLTDLLAPTAPPWLWQVPATERLRQIWVQNYVYENDQLHWRTNENIPQLPVLLAPRMIPKLGTQKSGIRRGSDTGLLHQARELFTTKQSPLSYSLRQGVEGTISQGVRAFGMRRSRYVGQRKTHLQHVALASAINIVRLAAWLQGEQPEKTRTSAFAKLFY